MSSSASASHRPAAASPATRVAAALAGVGLLVFAAFTVGLVIAAVMAFVVAPAVLLADHR